VNHLSLSWFAFLIGAIATLISFSFYVQEFHQSFREDFIARAYALEAYQKLL